MRYEKYNTHYRVEGGTTQNLAYNREVLTGGIGLQITPGTIVKNRLSMGKNSCKSQTYGLI